MNRILAASAAALALAACNPEFDPASQVEGLRVVAVRADPPEIAPHGDPDAAHTAVLGSLVLRPDWLAGAARTTVVYLACTPVPGVPAPSPCVLLSQLRDPTAALAEAAAASCDPEPVTTVPAPIVFAGAEVCDQPPGASGCRAAEVPGAGALPAPALSLPPGYGGLLAALPANAPERILGVEAAVLAFAVDAAPAELAAAVDPACPLPGVAANLARLWSGRAHVLSVKRVQIRGPEAPDEPNRNPLVEADGALLGPVGISARGAPLSPLAATTLTAGPIPLRPILPAGAAPQVYTELDAQGTPLQRLEEEWVTSWFSTAGELDVLHTRGDEAEEWTAPAPAPEAGLPAIVAAVVRDGRGGVAWAVREVEVVP